MPGYAQRIASDHCLHKHKENRRNGMTPSIALGASSVLSARVIVGKPDTLLVGERFILKTGMLVQGG